MNLLPKTKHEFTTIEYWNKFYKKRGKETFEWYGEYPELSDQLHKYIKMSDNILVIGCGNSKLSSDLYDVGFESITNIDLSPIVIKQMSDSNKLIRPNMKFIQMDATNMDFDDEVFNVVLDKGTVDALMQDDSDQSIEQMHKLFNEIDRVLKSGGRFICVSLLQQHILKCLVEYFADCGHIIRVIRNFKGEQKSKEISMPVFLFISTKMKSQQKLKIFELSLNSNKIERVQTIDEILISVQDVQQASLICLGLTQTTIPSGEEISIVLCNPNVQGDQKTQTRYTIYIQDNDFQKPNGFYAAFIVPQGKESDWLFSTPQGRRELARLSLYSRLAVVIFHRGHDYGEWDTVCSELSPTIKMLRPPTGNADQNIPFLSLGAEVGVGKRKIRYQGHSDISGPYVIEDVYDGYDIFRRLLFLDRPKVIQSEIKLKLSLGGGTLTSFIQKCYENCSTKIDITAVEIDSDMVKIAKDWFELQMNSRLHIIVDDGLNVLKQTDSSYNIIILDVDEKDVTIGMSGPPKEFLEDATLNNAKRCLKDQGILIINLACRNEELAIQVKEKLREHFLNVCSYKMDQDINEVVFCSNYKYDWANILKDSAHKLNKLIKKLNKDSDNIIEIDEFLKNLNII